ncbi:ABC transporter permease [Thalassobacillus sp. CUG 92003]|uniref:ABC transporter permease n=1 Tax=Thalassobacillus sp. CUG 92003 TaxID=2736641 RepID=UPI0015E639E6|nr:ABC transporter permease [Thalassobacillus sp. CUG 92003]
MIDAKAFWNRRFSDHLKEMNRYLRYMFNGHIAIAMLFFISALAYYYQQSLQDLPDDFPTAVIVGVVFGLVGAHSPVRTLLKEPDLVFLFPAEHQLNAYFKRCLLYSFVVQLYIVFLVAAALGPLYFASYPELGTRHYLMVIGALLILKVWNMLSNWWMLRERNPRVRGIDQALRIVLNVVVFYFLAQGVWLYAALVTVLLGGTMLYDYAFARKKVGLAWDLLVEKDQSRMRMFYRLANMFTDVPHLKNTVKKRHWLVRLVTKGVSYRQSQSYAYLYRITFIRSTDYLGMYLRLIVIGGAAVYFVPNIWVKIAFAILFLYLSAFQMMALWNHHRTIDWLDLYPIKQEWKKQAIMEWLTRLMILQTVLFVVLFIIQWNLFGSVVVLIGGGLFSFAFLHGYVKPRLT